MRRIILICATIASAVVAILAYQDVLRRTGNFHEVVAGQLYRSAQPTPDRLADYVEAAGIRSVVNLRGRRDTADWYVAEVEAARRLGLVHVDFGMSSSQPFSPERAEELVRLMQGLPKPILVHCWTGADRTGLVAMIYAYRLGGADEDTAEKQLSFAYGHVGLPFLSPSFAMDWSWETLEAAFGIEGS